MPEPEMTDLIVEEMLAMIIREPVAPVEQEEYVRAQWAGTMRLVEEAHDWERISRDESMLPGVREYARQRGEAIREEMRP